MQASAQAQCQSSQMLSPPAHPRDSNRQSGDACWRGNGYKELAVWRNGKGVSRMLLEAKRLITTCRTRPVGARPVQNVLPRSANRHMPVKNALRGRLLAPLARHTRPTAPMARRARGVCPRHAKTRSVTAQC